MRVLVTGGAGFVGSNLVWYLAERGYEVRALDNLSAGSRPPWWGRRSPVQVRQGDVEDGTAVRRAMAGVDAVVHLAARPGVMDSVTRPDLDFRANVLGTFTVFDAARRAKASHLVFASSGAVLAGSRPPLKEDMAPAVLSPYGASKLYGEGLMGACGAYGLTGISLRFANVYGPHSLHKGSVVSSFIKRIIEGRPIVIYGNGRQTRDFLYVGDVCTAIERAIAAPRGGTYHLGTGAETSVNALAAKVAAAAGAKPKISRRPGRPADALRSFVDLSSARRGLKWAPAVDLDQGLRETVAWMREAWPQAAISPK